MAVNEPEFNESKWRKSSRSGENGGACVAVNTDTPGVVGMRDTKDPGGPVLTFSPKAFDAFRNDIKEGLI